MKKVKSGLSRQQVITGLWLEKGCPERMKIHVKSTRETIFVLNGSLVTLTPKNKSLFMGTYEAQNRGLRVGQPVTLTRGSEARTDEMATRTCEACLGEIPAIRKSRRFCSPRCRVSAARDRKRARQVREVGALMTAAFGG
jgi:predicted nucleic acid-binding Zn ribbon protein